jgi:hypothetical protein
MVPSLVVGLVCVYCVFQLGFGPDYSILSMVSSEGEVVPLSAPIFTKQASGRIEIWLVQVRSRPLHHMFPSAL